MFSLRPWCCYNSRYQCDTNMKLKYCKISAFHNDQSSCPVAQCILKCTPITTGSLWFSAQNNHGQLVPDHDRVIVVLCAKQSLATLTEIMRKRDFAMLQFKTSFWAISYIAAAPYFCKLNNNNNNVVCWIDWHDDSGHLSICCGLEDGFV